MAAVWRSNFCNADRMRQHSKHDAGARSKKAKRDFHPDGIGRGAGERDPPVFD